MTIELCYNQDDNRKCGKRITVLKRINANLKHESNSTRMIISINESEFVDQCNYVRIVDINKNYFLQSINYNLGGIIVLELLEDVLETYSQYIKTLYTYVIRQEYKYNKYFIDDEYPLKITRSIDCVRGGSIGDPSTNNIILTVNGID